MPEPMPTGDVHRVEVPARPEQLERVGADTAGEVAMERRHHLEAALGRDDAGMLARLLEVAAVLDQLGAEAAHGGVLLAAVAVRHEDHDRHAERPAGVGEALAVVAARRRDDACDVRPLAPQAIEVDESARAP